MNAEIEEIMQKVVNKSLAQYGISEAECYYTHSMEDEFSLKDKKLEEKSISDTRGLRLRIIKNNIIGHAQTTDFSTNGLWKLIENAILNHRYQEKKYPIGFSDPIKDKVEDHLDPDYDKSSFVDNMNMLLELDDLVLKQDKRIKRIEQSSYSYVFMEKKTVNSRGFSRYERGGYGYIGIQAIAEDNGQEESGGGSQICVKRNEFDLEKIASEAVFDSSKLLGAKALEGFKGMVYLPPNMARILLSILSSSFSGEMVYKSKSLFPEIGEKIAPDFFELVDNPFLENGLGSYSVDSEGVSASRKSLVLEGRVNQHIYDRYYGYLSYRPSTGNGNRGGYKSLPYVGYSNYYLNPGLYSRNELLNLVSKGVYITDILGAHTANPITGDFSFGISGILIENGKKTIPFRGATMMGNLKDLLQQIIALGNDLEFQGSIGSPSILIDKISIAG